MVNTLNKKLYWHCCILRLAWCVMCQRKSQEADVIVNCCHGGMHGSTLQLYNMGALHVSVRISGHCVTKYIITYHKDCRKVSLKRSNLLPVLGSHLARWKPSHNTIRWRCCLGQFQMAVIKGMGWTVLWQFLMLLKANQSHILLLNNNTFYTELIQLNTSKQ